MSGKEKFVYAFGGGSAEGNASMRDLLGGKGANLADMAGMGLPVPPGFTITTEACDRYGKTGAEALFGLIEKEVLSALADLEKKTGKVFGHGPNPLLVSVRSGAASSMPGMMDTILNLGLNEETAEALIQKTGNRRFVLDSFRRFMQMFGDVVLHVDFDRFEKALSEAKEKKGVKLDTGLDADDLAELIRVYGAIIEDATGKPFPTDPREQLWQAIGAVFDSWNNPRAIRYRELNDIRNLLGTAVNVQAMVFGNSGDKSATGVAFSRDPSTGEHEFFYGEFLINAQGEDVVAGIRTPQQISLAGSRRWAEGLGISEEERKKQYPSLEEAMPECFAELDGIRMKLEDRFRDMQDMEFTIENGRLFMLQTRNGKRTAKAAVRIAVDLLKEGKIDEKTAVLRVEPAQLEQLLHPVFEKKAEAAAEKSGRKIAVGLAASPGAAVGQVVFSPEDAEAWNNEGKKVILCRVETSPEDIGGMNAAQGVLTARGGMTSHAAVVARGMGKCCVSGCGELRINYEAKRFTVGDKVVREGDFISLNGTTGAVYSGEVPTTDPELAGPFSEIMALADKYRKLGVRTNADNPRDTAVAVKFGAEGIGLCRTEHMFFAADRIVAFRRLILVAETVKKLKTAHGENELEDLRGKLIKLIAEAAEKFTSVNGAERDALSQQIEDFAARLASVEQYKKALAELLPLQRGDFAQMFKTLEGRACTIRFLDPPLHEFLPQEEKEQAEMAATIGCSVDDVKQVVDSLHEFNPMLGHRGCRLGITYPEVTAMQARAVAEAACEVPGSKPEIMIPLVGNVKELAMQKEIVLKEVEAVSKERGAKLAIKVGTMIEVPRAAVTAHEIAREAEFFSFGTNDLTQMGCGFSRDDAGKFLRDYVKMGIYDYDPFQVLDQDGVGELVRLAAERGRGTRKDIKLGICGEHGGEPRTIAFCHKIGLNYVSCSPYRVPVARLAAAQAALKND